MVEGIKATPEYLRYRHEEPRWRQWVPPYALGRAWPWRADQAEPAESSSSKVAQQEVMRLEPAGDRR